MFVAAIIADPRSNLKSNPRGILRIHMDITLSKVTGLNDTITHVVTNPKMDGNTRDSLKVCAFIHDKAIYDLKNAFRKISKTIPSMIF